MWKCKNKKKNKKCRLEERKEKHKKQREKSEMQKMYMCEKDWEDKRRIKQIEIQEYRERDKYDYVRRDIDM
jgi:hypothetical protein